MALAFGISITRSRRFGIKLRRNEDGATAVELGLIAFPFFAMMFGIMGVCHIFFWMFTLENALWSASRDMRTGAFQTASLGSRYAGKTGDALKTEFKKAICEKAVNYTECMSYSSILVQSNTGFGNLAQPNCRTASNGLVSDADAMAAFNAGAQSSVVLVTLCHSWRLGAKLPFLPMTNKLSDGGLLIQASAAFRTEPYN
jgi:Flp pilus assembly protein TadG